MTKRRSAFVLAAFLSVVLFTAIAGWRAYSPSEQRVYADLFAPLLIGRQKIEAVAWSHPSSCMKKSAPPGVSADLWLDFAEANDGGARPLRLHSLEGAVPVVSWETNERYFAIPSNIMQARLPNERPLAGLSRVGFSENGRYALVCVELYRHDYAQGDLFHLELKDGSWQLVEIISAWVS